MNRWTKWLGIFVVVAGFCATGAVAEEAKPAAGLIVRAKWVGKSADKAAVVPEAWIEVEVMERVAKSGRKKPAGLETLADWTELSAEKPTTFKSGGMTVMAEIKRGEKTVVLLSMSSGNANAMGKVTLEGKVGARQVAETSINNFLALEVVAAPAAVAPAPGEKK